MTTTAVCCTKCQTVLQGDVFNLPGLTPCPNCGALLQIEIFPALFRRIAPGRGAEATVEETESSCFYHPQKKAVLPCDACGRFLCALCDCELDGQHFCPACLEAGRTKGKIKKLENRRVVYDDLALALAVFSLIPPVIYFCWATAPLAIFLSIRHWNSPGSIIPRTKIRYVLAIIIALLDIAAIVAIIVAIASSSRTHR
jgi:hypothetical protein